MRSVGRSLALVLALAAVFMLTACLGVDVKTKFNADGSGTMTMHLRISQLFLQLGQEGEAPVPLTKEDLEANYEGLEGVSVESVVQENNDQDRIITSTVAFKNFEVFSKADDLAGAGAILIKEEGRTVYRVAIGTPPSTGSRPPAADSASAGVASPGDALPTTVPTEGNGSASEATTGQDDADKAMQAMLTSLVAGYSVSYTVTAPTPIVSHTVGELSEDGKSVHYSITMADYMDLQQPVMFEVKW